MMKKSLLVVFICTILSGCAQNKTDYLVTIKTDYGDMKAILYDETPKHKANFIKLAREKYYDSLLFHRVMPSFMIQGGDPDSKNAAPGVTLGQGGPDYTIDAEIKPDLYHQKGALAAARTSDNVNPTKASSGSQFYIVQGKKFTDEELTQLEQNMAYAKKNDLLRQVLNNPNYSSVLKEVIQHQNMQDGPWLNSFFENADTLIVKAYPDYKPYKFSAEQRKIYTGVGGVPHLDGDYTVFGKVISGLDVLDKIASVQCDPHNRPLKDVRMTVSVEELSRSEIKKQYGDDIYP